MAGGEGDDLRDLVLEVGEGADVAIKSEGAGGTGGQEDEDFGCSAGIVDETVRFAGREGEGSAGKEFLDLTVEGGGEFALEDEEGFLFAEMFVRGRSCARGDDEVYDVHAGGFEEDCALDAQNVEGGGGEIGGGEFHGGRYGGWWVSGFGDGFSRGEEWRVAVGFWDVGTVVGGRDGRWGEGSCPRPRLSGVSM